MESKEMNNFQRVFYKEPSHEELTIAEEALYHHQSAPEDIRKAIHSLQIMLEREAA